MNYSKSEVMQFVEDEDVKFIRLAFCDVNGHQKNISIMPGELGLAFEKGISIDGRALCEVNPIEEILLHPDPDTLSLLPWRPDHGKVVRMYCELTNKNKEVLELDKRSKLREYFDGENIFITEVDFYLLKLNDDGDRTDITYDNAGYMDIAPLDKCENVRRQVCLTMEIMGISPISSCHSFGPGQNRIAFKSFGALSAADNLLTFSSVVRTMAASNGLYADFSKAPKSNVPESRCKISIKDKKSFVFLPDINPYDTFINILEDIKS